MKFKNDRFQKTRGGNSRLLEIVCQKCSSPICRYQKDGAGFLKRMYIDRISDPQVSLQNNDLTCPQGHLLGVRIIYKKEDRPAFRIFIESVAKKIIKV